ncbi:stage II sporulation protein P [Desulfotomaculum copahuensis]|uniref:Stage II sporulation protein P n=1 Tax=Desulfotomaculum copahuensis TaxID=1838280 RepID=A0A1B7LIK9_9FIRM|nr:stage II sporulation protein P [Desulfotomaculum copahuensis]OAT86410.1 stage II sporulation protein P [Desulfotomaculum copahuensis]
MNKTRCGFTCGAVMLAAGLCLLAAAGLYRTVQPVFSPAFLFKTAENDHLDGRVIVIKDEKGRVISKTARTVTAGDEIYTAEGRHYRVNRVLGDTAYARFAGLDRDLLAYRDYYARLSVPVAAAAKNSGPVGIYHTHSDESYLPSDGADSIPFHGGIYQVGQSFVSRLQGNGVKVNYDKTPHDPHDNAAYQRSRRTAVNLMKSNPVALFDVHRDGVPDATFYRRFISNQDVTQTRLVVGRENPNMKANLDFAKRLMSYANSVHKPIVKEIFMGKGNYNQDLMPTAMLVEAGTYTNVKGEAERGVDLLAGAVPVVLGAAGPAKPGAPEYSKPVTDPTAATPGGWSALAWIIGLSLLVSGAFLVISSGGWEQARKRLNGFFGREFAVLPDSRPAKKPLLGKPAGTGRASGGEHGPDGGEGERKLRERSGKD